MHYEINTKKYLNDLTVDIDGMVVRVTLPGAGTELALSQSQRRLSMLSKKFDSGEADMEDIEAMEKYEKGYLEYFAGIFRDDTEDNSKVSAWVNSTPAAVIMAMLEDIKGQSKKKQEAKEAKEKQDAGKEEAS